MLLKKRYGRQLSALSLSLAFAFAPLFNVQLKSLKWYHRIALPPSASSLPR